MARQRSTDTVMRWHAASRSSEAGKDEAPEAIQPFLGTCQTAARMAPFNAFRSSPHTQQIGRSCCQIFRHPYGHPPPGTRHTHIAHGRPPHLPAAPAPCRRPRPWPIPGRHFPGLFCRCRWLLSFSWMDWLACVPDMIIPCLSGCHRRLLDAVFCDFAE